MFGNNYNLLMNIFEANPKRLKELQKYQIVPVRTLAELDVIDRTLPDFTDLWVQGYHLSFILGRRLGAGHVTSFEAVEGLNILDIASGSVFSRNILAPFAWYPHFSRIAAMNGGNVVALDINPQHKYDSELFTAGKVDLVKLVSEGGLASHPLIKGKQFDIIHSENFIGTNSAPDLKYDLANFGISLQDFECRIKTQSGELLAEGGIMDLDLYNNLKDNAFKEKRYFTKKENGQLIDCPKR